MMAGMKGAGICAVAFALAIGFAGKRRAAQRKFSFAYDQPKTTAYGIAANIFEPSSRSCQRRQDEHQPVPRRAARPGAADAAEAARRRHRLRHHLDRQRLDAGAAGRRVLAALHLPRPGAPGQGARRPGVVDGVPRRWSRSRCRARRCWPASRMGMRNMYSKKEVKSVDDIKGKKMRVQATKTEDTHFPAYGAQTVHMPFGEVYTSLQTGVVNVAENGVNVYLANKHYEVAPVLSMTEHEANNNCIWVSDKTWNSLTPSRSNGCRRPPTRSARPSRRMALKLEKDSAEKLKAIGVKVVENVDKSGFMKAAAPIQDQLANELGPHAVKILELVRNVK